MTMFTLTLTFTSFIASTMSNLYLSAGTFIDSVMNIFKTETCSVVFHDYFQKSFSSTNVLILISMALTIFTLLTLTFEINELLALKRSIKTSDENTLESDEIVLDVTMSHINYTGTNKHSIDLKVPIDPGEVVRIEISSEIDDNNLFFECENFANYLKWDLCSEELEKLSYSEKARRFYILTNKEAFMRAIPEIKPNLQLEFQEISCVALSGQTSDLKRSDFKARKRCITITPAKEIIPALFKPMNELHNLKAQFNDFDIHKIELMVMKNNSKLTMSFLKKIFNVLSRLCFNQCAGQYASATAKPKNKLALIKPEPFASANASKQSIIILKIMSHLSKKRLKHLLDFIIQLQAPCDNFYFYNTKNKHNLNPKLNDYDFKIDCLPKYPHASHRKRSNQISNIMNRNRRRLRCPSNKFH